MSVVDRDGRPIRGLPRGAFTVFEDGRQVELVGFDEVRPDGLGDQPPRRGPKETPLPLPGETHPRYLAIWVDVAATDPLHRNRALRELAERAAAGDLAGWWTSVVAFDGEIEVLHDIEHDPLGVELSLGAPRPVAPGLVEVAARIRVPLARLSLVPHGGLHLGRVELFLAGRDGRGRRSVPQRFVIDLRLSEEDLRRGLVTREVDLTLREDSTAIALTVFDDLGGNGSYLLRPIQPPEALASPPHGSRP